MRRILVVTLLLSSLAILPARAAQNFVVFFTPWSAAFDQPALDVIGHAAAAAKANPNASVTITSAADTVGGHQANVYLSETRAQVVADALASEGIQAARIHQVSLGAQGSTPNTYSQFDRRVVITVGD